MKKSLFSFLGATALLVTFTACNNGPSEAEVEKMRADSLAKAQATADSILAAESAAKAKATQDSIDAAAAAPAKAAPIAPVALDKKGGKPTPKPAKKPVMKPATKPTTKVEPAKVIPTPAPVDPKKVEIGKKGGGEAPSGGKVEIGKKGSDAPAGDPSKASGKVEIGKKGGN